MFDLKLTPSPREDRGEVPRGSVRCRCGIEGGRVLKFPKWGVIEDLARKHLSRNIKVIREYDTCIIFLIDVVEGEEIKKEETKLFLCELAKLIADELAKLSPVGIKNANDSDADIFKTQYS